MYESSRMRTKQERGGAVQRAGDARQRRRKQARTEKVQISRTSEKAQAESDSPSNVARKSVATKTAHHEMSSAVVWIVCCRQPRSLTPHPSSAAIPSSAVSTTIHGDARTPMGVASTTVVDNSKYLIHSTVKLIS
jgi:hypothetical protein